MRGWSSRSADRLRCLGPGATPAAVCVRNTADGLHELACDGSGSLDFEAQGHGGDSQLGDLADELPELVDDER